MIEKAVQRRPNDGAIVDSLGWVMLRQGEVTEAVKTLERAVELDPEDASINGHLGDAYWAAGRKLEATYQWRRALIFNPEPDDAAKLEAKLQGDGTPVGGCQRPVGLVPDRPDRAGAGQGQSVPAPDRSAGGRLPPAGQPGRVRRGRRHAARGAGGDAVAAGRGAVCRGACRRSGQPGAACRAGAGGGGRHRRARPSGAGQAPAGGLRHRRRFGGCCGGAAAALPPVADRAGTCGAGPPRGRAWARMFRFASPAARAAWVASANVWIRHRCCRRAGSCWSIRAWRWRPPRCSGPGAAPGRPRRSLPASWHDASGDGRRSQAAYATICSRPPSRCGR